MIQPALSGSALLADIEQAQPRPGQVALWWLGQSGYAIKSATTLIYIDLYLSEHLTAKYANTEKPHIRMTEAPLRGADITNAELVLASHKHSDHLDPGTLPALFAASPDARLVLPAALLDYAAGLGLARERLIGTRGDETLHESGITIHSIPSAHPDFDNSNATGYPFLGFVLEMDGVRLYHSGDTVLYDGAGRTAARLRPGYFCSCRSTARTHARDALHVPPNMSSADTVTLAGAGRGAAGHPAPLRYVHVQHCRCARVHDAGGMRRV